MKLEKIISVLGPPGSGKGTQSKLLVEKTGYAFFSMGETLRKYALENNEVGHKIKALIDQGIIVTDDLAEIVVSETWAKIETDGLISEGYPRTFGQVEVLDRIMKQQDIHSLKVLAIMVDKQKLIDRIIKRAQIEGRADDADTASIEKRFDEYEIKTAKIIEFYRGKGLVIDINGDQSEDMNESIQKVHQEILVKLGLS